VDISLTANETIDLTTPFQTSILVSYKDELNEFSKTIPVELAKPNSLKEYLINGSPWDWRNYGEHAIYTFTENNIEEKWEKQDSNGNFTGTFDVELGTWDLLGEDSFWIFIDDYKSYNKIISKEDKTFNFKSCENSDFTECDENVVFTSLN